MPHDDSYSVSDQDDDDFEPDSEPVKRKRASYKKKRSLISWDADKEIAFLLFLVQECDRRGVVLPIEEAIAHINPGSTAEAVRQHLSKMCTQRREFGLIAPDRLGKAVRGKLAVPRPPEQQNTAKGTTGKRKASGIAQVAAAPPTKKPRGRPAKITAPTQAISGATGESDIRIKQECPTPVTSTPATANASLQQSQTSTAQHSAPDSAVDLPPYLKQDLASSMSQFRSFYNPFTTQDAGGMYPQGGVPFMNLPFGMAPNNGYGYMFGRLPGQTPFPGFGNPLHAMETMHKSPEQPRRSPSSNKSGSGSQHDTNNHFNEAMADSSPPTLGRGMSESDSELTDFVN